MKMFKQIITGTLIAASGAYAWAVLTFELSEKGPGESRLLFRLWVAPLVAAYSVLITSWFVFPIGALLGVVMPKVIQNCSRSQALVRGLFLGGGVGSIAAALTTVFMQWPDISGNATIVNRQAYLRSVCNQFTGYLLTMIPVCAVWVSVWAWMWRKNLAATSIAPT